MKKKNYDIQLSKSPILIELMVQREQRLARNFFFLASFYLQGQWLPSEGSFHLLGFKDHSFI